jgi:protein TonB
VVAPPPEIRLDIPPPVIAAPVPTPIEGSDPSAGAADVKGPGTGSGGQGTGTGSGNAGGGTGGGGGGGARAQLVRGRLMNEDYPRSALRAGIQGSVSVRFTVDTDGVARDCLVTRSSGNADLDTTTCRLIERRFRYRAARDAQGKPVPETIGKTYDWLLPLRR